MWGHHRGGSGVYHGRGDIRDELYVSHEGAASGMLRTPSQILLSLCYEGKGVCTKTSSTSSIEMW